MQRLILSVLLCCSVVAHATVVKQTKGDFEDKFRQLDEILPTPNVYRNAAGEPGHAYWQQQVDYAIRARLIEGKRRIEATQDIVYHNNSPDTLKYLWVQLDQNRFKPDSMANLTTTFGGIGTRGPATRNATDSSPAKISLGMLRREQFLADVAVGYDISRVVDGFGNPLKYTIVGTLMRVDLPQPLSSGEKIRFSLDFAFNIVEEDAVSARSGYEHFPDDPREGGNGIFLLAQWFPRMVAYTDYEAWTNKEFIGRGEFTLEFGDYDVSLANPSGSHCFSDWGITKSR